MATPSERVFRDTLCESRSYAVETTDPTSARTIDELRRQVKELRAAVDADKVKHRQMVRDHEKQLQHIREEEARRLDAALEACVVRKEQEKVNELKKLEERFKKLKEQEIRQFAKEKGDELNKSYRKWQMEKNEAIRIAVETERRQSMEDLQSSFAEEEAHAREDKLTREVFILGEQNSTLEQQVRNLSRLNRAQIDQMRRMKQECDAKVESVIRQHKTEASREMAQLKLAEQIIAEKDHEIHAIGYRADMAMMEKEALEEEVVAIKSIQNTSNSSVLDSSGLQETSTPSRRSMGGGNVIQKRVEELEAQVKRLEEEKASLKQSNASLRKKAVLQDEGEKKASGGKAAEEKLKTLRKKNSELAALTKELDDRIKALKAENDQLKTKTPSGESEQNIHKALARRHAKDISEYTKQIHAKDREVSELKKKVAKLEAAASSYSEPAPELQRKVKSMAMDKLRMEKLIAKLYSRLPDVVNPEDLSHKDLLVESGKLEQLTSENQALHSRVQALQEAALRDKQDRGGSISLQEKEELLAEISRLRKLAQSASELESQCVSLKRSCETLEATNSSLEQRCHELGQQLKISTLAVKELEGSQEVSSELESQVEQLKAQLGDREDKMTALEVECNERSAQLSGKQAIIEVLQRQVETLEGSVQERDKQNSQLRSALESLQVKEKPSIKTADIGTQSPVPREEVAVTTTTTTTTDMMPPLAEPTQKPIPAVTKVRADGGSKRFPKERIRSPIRRSLRSHSPRTSSGDLLDSSLDNEMRAAGFDVNDSYDSSEGIGFSDTNLDTSVLGSDQSVTKEEGGDLAHDPQQKPHPHKMAWEEDRTDQAQATGSDRHGQEGEEVEGLVVVDGVRSNEGAESGQLSPEPSDGDVVASSQDKDSDDSPTPDSYKVGVYIAKYSYNPSEMSPNQNFDLELELTAGDYLYVYGDMDDDGYYHGQLMSGQSGMVPSNFIEKVTEDDEDVSQPSRKSQKNHSSHLQDIEEVDENTTSSGGFASIAPPSGLTLERQFVEGGQYSVAIQWELPRPLPEGLTGYTVYVNGEYNYDVNGGEQTSVLLTAIPRKQLVKISVRTTTEEGESPDPPKLIILNPQYPEAPTNIRASLSTSPTCLMVHWTPSTPLKEGNPISGYTVHLNSHNCVQLGTNPKPVKSVSAQVFANDLRDCKEKLVKAEVVSLTVCAVSGDYSSVSSIPVIISKVDVLALCDAGKMTADESEITSSATSLSSIEVEEEREVYSPGKREEELRLQEVGVTMVDGGVTVAANGVHVADVSPPPSNGTVHEEDRHTGPATYYRALVSYNPQLQSPNEDAADEELAFHENDIIIGLEPVDEDGFVMAELNGCSGYIPGNLVEELTDQDELLRVPALLQEQRSGVRGGRGMNGTSREALEVEGQHKMKALFDYDPAQDSPNENSEVELAIAEGDLVTVFGKPDVDGFFKAEAGGKKGLVPSNYLGELTPPRNDGIEVFAADENAMKIADQIIQMSQSQSSEKDASKEKGSSHQKRSLLSRGKNLLSKGKGNK